jgi:hypothetical protein
MSFPRKFFSQEAAYNPGKGTGGIMPIGWNTENGGELKMH